MNILPITQRIASGNKELETQSKCFIGHDDQKMTVNTHTQTASHRCRAEATPLGPPPPHWASPATPCSHCPTQDSVLHSGFCSIFNFSPHGAWTLTVKKSRGLDLSLRWAGLQCPRVLLHLPFPASLLAPLPPHHCSPETNRMASLVNSLHVQTPKAEGTPLATPLPPIPSAARAASGG